MKYFIVFTIILSALVQKAYLDNSNTKLPQYLVRLRWLGPTKTPSQIVSPGSNDNNDTGLTLPNKNNATSAAPPITEQNDANASDPPIFSPDDATNATTTTAAITAPPIVTPNFNDNTTVIPFFRKPLPYHSTTSMSMLRLSKVITSSVNSPSTKIQSSSQKPVKKPSLKKTKTPRLSTGFSFNFNRPSVSSSSPSSSTNSKSSISKTAPSVASPSSSTTGSSTGSSSTSSSSSPSPKKKKLSIQPYINKALKKMHMHMPKESSRSIKTSKLMGQPVKASKHRNRENFNRPSVSSTNFSPSSSKSKSTTSIGSTSSIDASLDSLSSSLLPSRGGKTVKTVTPNNSTLITTVFDPQKEWSSSSTEVITQIIKKTLIKSHVHRNHLMPYVNGTLPANETYGDYSPRFGEPMLITTNSLLSNITDMNNLRNNTNSNTYTSST